MIEDGQESTSRRSITAGHGRTEKASKSNLASTRAREEENKKA